MRLSEAIRLGSLVIQNPCANDSRYCAIGMACEAVGQRTLKWSWVGKNYDTVAAHWPWMEKKFPGSWLKTYMTEMVLLFDGKVMAGKMTLEALCDIVAGWENELESKGVNVEQVSMIATPGATHEPAAEHTEKVLVLSK